MSGARASTAAVRGGPVALLIATASALSFGTSGTIAKPLLEAGWSPPAVVFLRILGAALALLVPALVVLHRGPGLAEGFRLIWRARVRVLVYGVFAVAGTQLCYFAAIQRIPVGLALLIEYLAPIGLLLFMWMRTRRRPALGVLLGAGLALVGLLLVIGIDGSVRLDPLGILYASIAAVGLAIYFVLGAVADDGVPAMAFAWTTLTIGAAILGLLAAVRVLPWASPGVNVAFLGASMPWFVPVIAVALLSTAFAYFTGIIAAARLGSRQASFFGLLEVIAGVVISWIVLGEALALVQIVGAVLILGGVALIRPEPQKVEPQKVEPPDGPSGSEPPEQGEAAHPQGASLPIVPG
ncbi:DMT family transporter [Schumannella sp. 10F1B-5-1]|uniref:EamA family transporter n=1 Tax=Schumannella sp. 10F1B-5-1 TaxID=2590780 RepID=UPI0011320D0B|nr:EamA family transporter [Schumannella sp. 10F1B-5-1]TPW73050.1 EamA family transporter [Schumannella sp. 10F1B-5-1]